jgi:Kef-type K+ transport system membrane component KefB
MNNLNLAVQFFLQLAVILVFCRFVGAVAARFGQPQVVAEMIAGVMLGPSLFGLLWPEAQEWLFPWDTTQKTRDTQSYLFPASQLGLALYMFVVGMGSGWMCAPATETPSRSIAGMVAPFLLGAGLGIFFHFGAVQQNAGGLLSWRVDVHNGVPMLRGHSFQETTG